MLGRFPGQKLAIPGVLGMVSYQGLHYVRLGPDAGWPEPQAMLDWKSACLVLEKRMLTLESRPLLHKQLPDEELALALARNADMACDGAPPLYDEAELTELRLAHLPRLVTALPHLLDTLREHGVPVYRVGYSRVTSYLQVEFSSDQRAAPLWIHEPALQSGMGTQAPPPRGVSPQEVRELAHAVWIDRVLRAITKGVLSEGALQAALGCDNRFWNSGPLILDGVVEIGSKLAAQMAAGASEINLPFHGRAVRVWLPPFTLVCEDTDPFAQPRVPPHRQTVQVPAESVWLVTGT